MRESTDGDSAIVTLQYNGLLTCDLFVLKDVLTSRICYRWQRHWLCSKTAELHKFPLTVLIARRYISLKIRVCELTSDVTSENRTSSGATNRDDSSLLVILKSLKHDASIQDRYKFTNRPWKFLTDIYQGFVSPQPFFNFTFHACFQLISLYTFTIRLILPLFLVYFHFRSILSLSLYTFTFVLYFPSLLSCFLNFESTETFLSTFNFTSSFVCYRTRFLLYYLI